jgi:hypothetical protein
MYENPWYARWEGAYVGSGDEHKNFQKWYDDRNDEGRIDPDRAEEDLLDEYRDTQVWTDSFLDWAWVMEAEERMEDIAEGEQQ